MGDRDAHEREERIKAARTLVGTPILFAIADSMAERGGCDDLVSAICASIRDAPWRQVGEIVISDACFAPYEMHLRMSRVPRGYAFDMDIPVGYERAMRDKFALFGSAVRAFWSEWRASVGAKLRATYPTLMPTALDLESLSGTETAFFAHADDTYWAGIFGYLTDKDGRKYTSQHY
jgi:hypothetical protein